MVFRCDVFSDEMFGKLHKGSLGEKAATLFEGKSRANYFPDSGMIDAVGMNELHIAAFSGARTWGSFSLAQMTLREAL